MKSKLYLITIPLAFAAGFLLRPASFVPTNTEPTARIATTSPSNDPARESRDHSSLNARLEASLSTLLNTPHIDLAAVAAGIGSLTRLSDAEASIAFHSLATRQPRADYVGSLAAGYLWHRERRKNPMTPMPQGWSLEKYPLSAAGDGGDWNQASVHAAIASGEIVSSMDRERYFAEAVRKDPAAAFAFWLKHHHPEMQVEEMRWFVPMFETAENRALLVDLLRASSMDDLLKQELICGMYASWVLVDPEAAGRWPADPSVSAYRTRLEETFASLRVQLDPQNAWSLSDQLGEKARLHAQIRASAVLARDNPDMAIEKLATVTDPKHRETLVQTFGEGLAIYHYDKWTAWRDSLPPNEQDKVNAAAFETWIGQDPAAALTWMEKQAPGPEKSRMMADFASRFSIEQSDTVAAWIRTIPDPNERLTIAIAGIRGLPDDAHDKIRSLLDAVR